MLSTYYIMHYASNSESMYLELRTIGRFISTYTVVLLQTKFYPVTSGNHLTWGTEVKQIQLEGRGEFGGGAMQHLAPTNITFL